MWQVMRLQALFEAIQHEQKARSGVVLFPEDFIFIFALQKKTSSSNNMSKSRQEGRIS